MPTADPRHEPITCCPLASSDHPRFIYRGRGCHAPPIVSNEEHDPLTERGRRAICHLIALAEYDRAAFRTDIAYIRHCQARARYLHEHIGDLTRHALDDLLRRPPAVTMRSLLPDGWNEAGAADVAGGED